MKNRKETRYRSLEVALTPDATAFTPMTAVGRHRKLAVKLVAPVALAALAWVQHPTPNSRDARHRSETSHDESHLSDSNKAYIQNAHLS
jgi:hypothetical protein